MFGLFKKRDPSSPTHTPPGTLEEQLAVLAGLGFSLNEGVTIDDLLHSFGREVYEKRPFDLILFMLGAEIERQPWGRPICSRVWNFDTECIDETGDYVHIVKRLCTVAGKPGYLTDIEDLVDFDDNQAWLKYQVQGKQRHLELELSGDWADAQRLTEVMADLESDGRRFYFKDNGQAMVLYYLDAATAAELNRLSSGALSAVIA